MKTLGKFVLIDNERNKETVLNWGPTPMVKTTAAFRLPDMNYSARKTIISDLHPYPTKQPSQTKSIANRNLLTTTSTKHITPFVYANPQRQRPNSDSKRETMGTTLYRTHSLRKISSNREPRLPKKPLKEEELR